LSDRMIEFLSRRAEDLRKKRRASLGKKEFLKKDSHRLTEKEGGGESLREGKRICGFSSLSKKRGNNRTKSLDGVLTEADDEKVLEYTGVP